MSHPLTFVGGAAPATYSLDREIEALHRILGGVGLINIALAVSLGAAAALGILALGRALRRSGLDPNQRTTPLMTFGVIAAILIVGDALLRWFLERVPLLALGALCALLVLLGISALGLIRDLLAGVGLALRGDLTPGVHLTAGELEGIVERVGPTTVRLETADGSALYIPNGQLRRGAFVTREPHSTAQVTVQFQLSEPATSRHLSEARDAALLCPYRAFDSEVSVRAVGPRDLALEITFHAPSERVARGADRFIRRTLEARFGQPQGLDLALQPSAATAPESPKRGQRARL